MNGRPRTRRRFLADMLFAGGGLAAAAVLFRAPRGERPPAPPVATPPVPPPVDVPAPPEEVMMKGVYVLPEAEQPRPQTRAESPVGEHGTVVKKTCQKKEIGDPHR